MPHVPEPSPLPPDAVLALRRAVTGRVLHRTDPAYPEGQTAPVVVRPADGGDVEAALRAVVEHRLALGSQVNVMVDRLTELRIDAESRTAAVGAGTTWGELAAAAAGHGLAPVPTFRAEESVVEAARHGGLGPLTPTHGWGADRLIELQHHGAAGLHLVTGAVVELVEAPCLRVDVRSDGDPAGAMAVVHPDGTVTTTTYETAGDGTSVADVIKEGVGPAADDPGILLTHVDDEAFDAMVRAARHLATPIVVLRLGEQVHRPIRQLSRHFAEQVRGATYLVCVPDPDRLPRLESALEPWLTGAGWPPA